eukprot:13834807-Ditylum_brightwellii.AAC.1
MGPRGEGWAVRLGHSRYENQGKDPKRISKVDVCLSATITFVKEKKIALLNLFHTRIPALGFTALV